MNSSERADGARDPARAQRIVRLNDELRQECQGGFIIATRGVRDMPGFEAMQLVRLLADYDAFDEDNDPYGERDFGDLTLCGQSLLWKIDYYDSDMLYGSPDPSDTAVTLRVLTVMLAEEW